MRVRRLPGAIADLDEIYDYLAARDQSAADRLVDDITRSIEALAQHPYLGRERIDIHQDARSRVVGHYLILYRITDTAVEIVRIIHGARDLSGAFESLD